MSMNILTRADMDGLVCAALFQITEKTGTIRFTEPKFMQDGEVKVFGDDIIANLPYDPACAMWFDHHISNNIPQKFKGAFRIAPSAARVVFEYYLPHFPDLYRYDFLLHHTDKIDAAYLSREDVLNPEGYLLISMTVDGKYYEDAPYWLHLIDLFKNTSLDDTMSDSEVIKRCKIFLDSNQLFQQVLKAHSHIHRNILITDFRGVPSLPNGNRYLNYAYYPESNISLKISNDKERDGYISIGVGHNIFNRTSRANVGELLKKYGGGGHRAVGSTRVTASEADRTVAEIIAHLENT